MEKSDTVSPLVFRSYKARSITIYGISFEFVAFRDKLYHAVPIAQDISLMLAEKISIQLFTKNKSLFDVISKGSRTSEKRMMSDFCSTGNFSCKNHL